MIRWPGPARPYPGSEWSVRWPGPARPDPGSEWSVRLPGPAACLLTLVLTRVYPCAPLQKNLTGDPAGTEAAAVAVAVAAAANCGKPEAVKRVGKFEGATRKRAKRHRKTAFCCMILDPWHDPCSG